MKKNCFMMMAMMMYMPGCMCMFRRAHFRSASVMCRILGTPADETNHKGPWVSSFSPNGKEVHPGFSSVPPMGLAVNFRLF